MVSIGEILELKLEGLSIDNDNAEDENGATGTDEIFALRYQTACRQASLRYNFTALCETKRNENKRTPEGVYAGCAGVCKDYFERSWTVVLYMGWYDM